MLKSETACADVRTNADRKCVFCGKCQPCPKGIPISKVIKLLESIPEDGRAAQELLQEYAQLPRHAGRCVACKRCESRCPHCVPIVKNMRKASLIFGR